jgi:hypothetical protein
VRETERESNLHLGHLADAFIQSNLQYVNVHLSEGETIYRCQYSKEH